MKLDDAGAMAEAWMEHHGLQAWRFRFDDAKRRFGRCSYLLREITLSRTLVELNDERHVEDTILHEIAHALAGRGVGHGPAWKRIAASIGASPRPCYGAEVVRPPGRWIGTCWVCRSETQRHKRPTGISSCGRCSPRKFDERYVIIWRPS